MTTVQKVTNTNNTTINKSDYEKQYEKAVKEISKEDNFEKLDTASWWGSVKGKDGKIGKADLEAAAKNEELPKDLRDACQFLIDNPDAYKQFATAGDNSSGTISQQDVDAAVSEISKSEQKTSTDPLDGIENEPGVPGNADQAFDFFIAKGLTPEQAAGIVANLNQESGFDPSAVGDNGTAFGIAQLRNNPNTSRQDAQRYDNMVSWTKENGYDPTSFRGQLEFVWHEMTSAGKNNSFPLNNNNLYNDIKNSNSAYEVAGLFSRGYENPKVDESHSRGESAKTILEQQKQRLGL